MILGERGGNICENVSIQTVSDNKQQVFVGYAHCVSRLRICAERYLCTERSVGNCYTNRTVRLDGSVC